MTSEVTIHSDEPGGIVRMIHFKKNGADTGHIDIESSNAPGSRRSYDLKDIKADPIALRIVSELDALFSAAIDISVERATAAKSAVATITVSHALFGNGVYVYPLRAGDDGVMETFLRKSAFPLAA